MVERVMVVARNRRNPVLMDVRLARHLVALGAFQYVTEQSHEPAPAKKPKKRAYKRRDMQAED